jgi:probable phosphoglycerate mutase
LEEIALRTIYVVTHPEATHVTERLVGGWYDSRLTDGGHAAAAEIAADLHARIPVGATVELYASDLTRTRQTAAAIAHQFGVTAVFDPDLRERSYGEAEGKTVGTDARFIPLPADGDRLHHHDGVPGSETTWTFATRVYAAMDRITAHEAEHRIIVTHGGTLTFVAASWLRLPIDALAYAGFRARPGSITVLTENVATSTRQIVVG